MLFARETGRLGKGMNLLGTELRMGREDRAVNLAVVDVASHHLPLDQLVGLAHQVEGEDLRSLAGLESSHFPDHLLDLGHEERKTVEFGERHDGQNGLLLGV